MVHQLQCSIPEGGVALGIGRSKMYELIAAGEIATVTIGRRRLIPIAELERYAAQLTDAQRVAS